MAKKVAWATIKVPRKTYETAKQILRRVSAQGWSVIGVDRSDSPTLGAVFEEIFNKGETR